MLTGTAIVVAGMVTAGMALTDGMAARAVGAAVAAGGLVQQLLPVSSARRQQQA